MTGHRKKSLALFFGEDSSEAHILQHCSQEEATTEPEVKRRSRTHHSIFTDVKCDCEDGSSEMG